VAVLTKNPGFQSLAVTVIPLVTAVALPLLRHHDFQSHNTYVRPNNCYHVFKR